MTPCSVCGSPMVLAPFSLGPATCTACFVKQHERGAKLWDEIVAENNAEKAQLAQLTAERDKLKAELEVMARDFALERSSHTRTWDSRKEARAERDALKAELNRERASLSAACEASDRRAAALNREVIADNERLRAEVERLKTLVSVQQRAGLNRYDPPLVNWKDPVSQQLTELRDAVSDFVRFWDSLSKDDVIYDDAFRPLRAVLAKLTL